MRITVESTSQVVTMNGVACRVWDGRTKKGVQVHCFIVRIAAHESEPDLSEFERDLEEHAKPSAAVAAIPIRLLI